MKSIQNGVSMTNGKICSNAISKNAVHLHICTLMFSYSGHLVTKDMNYLHALSCLLNVAMQVSVRKGDSAVIQHGFDKIQKKILLQVCK